MKYLKSIKNIKGKKILVRVDFNVPIVKGKILDDFRIKKALPTINFLKQKGAKVILISHLGENGIETLAPVAKAGKFKFINKIIGPQVNKAIEEMKNGDVLLLENLRKEKGEKENGLDFAKKLAKYGDIYVNDAFPVSHRSHASIVLLPKILPAYAGFQLEEEIKQLSRAIKNPPHPFLFILGGAKFETKIPLIKKFLNKSDAIFVGGALMNNFFWEQGLEIGRSMYEKKKYGLIKLLKNDKIILPIDVLVQNKKIQNKIIEAVKKDETIVDVGEISTDIAISLIKKAKFILLNGPMGNYEKGFGKATEKIINEIIHSKAKSIIGGGDTVTLLSKLKDKGLRIKDNIFISSGGGATLEFLSKGTLPGIKALR